MKLFKRIFIANLMLLLLSSCNKDDDLVTKADNNPDTPISIRSIDGDTDISYKLRTETILSPDQGSLQDMCPGDIRMLQEESKLYDVSTSISPNGSLCIKIAKKRQPLYNKDGGNKGDIEYIRESETSYCDGIMTYTTPDTTITTTVNQNLSFWQSVAQSYLMTDAEIAASFNKYLNVMADTGANIVKDDKTIVITETADDGSQVISTYDKETMLLIGIEYRNQTGETLRTMNYVYQCTSDGRFVPGTIITTSKGQSSICSTPFTKTKWMMFEDFQINI